MHACMLSHFTHVQLFGTLWTIASRLLCPWDSLGKNTGVSFHALCPPPVIWDFPGGPVCEIALPLQGAWV